MSDEKIIWSQLKYAYNAINKQPIKVYKRRFTIGRSSKCDLIFTDNKLLSQEHAYIEKDDENRIWFVDTSKNGSLINLNTKIHNARYEIHDRDILFLVYRLNEPDKNICFHFELYEQTSLNSSNKSTATTMSSSTLSSSVQALKRTKCSSNSNSVDVKVEDEDDGDGDDDTSNGRDTNGSDDVVQYKKAKVEEADSSTATHARASPTTPPPPVTISTEAENNIDATLTCCICTEIMHDCVSLQPCMHPFCAGCYSGWMQCSSECPICRLKVDRICKNHIVNNLIEGYLKMYPNKRRPQKDIDELNRKNKITKDMLYPKTIKSDDNEGDGENEDAVSDEYDYSDNDDDDDEENEVDNNNARPIGIAFAAAARPLNHFVNPYQGLPVGIGPGFNTGSLLYRYTCRQCPQNKPFYGVANGAYPDFTCSIVQNHILCQCCLEAMPDRSVEILNNPSLPKQMCTCCFKAYCNLYWGCKKNGVGCNGCLNKLKDFNLNETDFQSQHILCDNNYETELLLNYIKQKLNKTLNDVLKECMEKLVNGEYKLNVIFNPNIYNQYDKVVCRNCAIKAFKDILYQYRCDQSNSQYFKEKTNDRPDCKWGRECRTQKHNADHAKRYNHICEKAKDN